MAEAVLKFAGDVQVKDGVITAVLSTEAVDRDGDVVTLEGWDLTNFARAPRLMSCHDYGSLTKQIGEWRNVRVDKARGALIGEPHYYTGQGNPEADWGYYLASIGQATYSVGFNPYESEPRKGHGGYVYTRKELLEASHVPIPANQDAVQLMAKAFQLRHAGQPSQTGRTVHKDAMDGTDEQTCIQMAQDILGRLNELILHESQEQVDGSDEDDDIRLLLACRDMIQQFQRNEMLGDGGDYGYGSGYAYLAAITGIVKGGKRNSSADIGLLKAAHDSLHSVLAMPHHDLDGAATDTTDDGTEDPATQRDKAMGEGSGSDGGVTVSDSGTHGATTEKHSHPHDAAGHSHADANGLHEHSHSHDGDGNHGHSHDGVNFKTAREIAEAVEKSHSELPDSAFACISPGGKVEDGKTRPLSLRHYPHHTASGGVDKALLRAALSRIGDSSNEQCGKAHLEAHAKAEGIGENADKKAFDWESIGALVEERLTKAWEGA